MEGTYKLDDLNDALHTDLTSEDYDSIGGYLVGLLDHFPDEGETCSNDAGYRFVAEKVDHNRIESVRIFLPENFMQASDENAETQPEDHSVQQEN